LVTGDSSSVTLSVHSGPGSLNGTLTEAASGGVATFADLSINTAGSYTLTAADGSLTSDTSSSFTISPAAAAKVVYAQQPTSATAGSTISPAVTVDVEDQYGNLVTGDSSSVTLSVHSGPGSLNGTLTEAASGGVATFADLSINTTGSYTLAASDGSLMSGTSNGFIVAAAPATHLLYLQQPTNALAGASINPAIVLQLLDPYGNLVTSDNSEVTLLVHSGPGELAGTVTLAAVHGVATFSDVTAQIAGSYTLTASDGGLTAPVSDSFSIRPAAPAKVVFVQPPTDVTAGNTLSSTVVLNVEDPFGNLITTDNSTVSLSVASGPGSLNGTLSVAASGGVATFSDLSLQTAGLYTLLASDATLASATSDVFTVTPAAAAKLVFVQQPADVPAGQTLGPAIIVDIEDQFGNVVTSDNSNVTISTAGGTGTLAGSATTVAAQNGVATFSDLSLLDIGTYSLQAADGDLAPAASNSFTVSPAVASQVSLVQQQYTAPAYGMVCPYLCVAVEDLFGNSVTDDTSSVTASILWGPADAQLLGKSTVPVLNGYATFDNLRPSRPGDYRFALTDGDLTKAVSGTFHVYNIPLNWRWWYGDVPFSAPVLVTSAHPPIVTGSAASASPKAAAPFVAAGIPSQVGSDAVAPTLSTHATDALATSNDLLK